MKKVDPTRSSVAESSGGRVGAFAQKNLGDAEAADDHGDGQDRCENDAEPGCDVARAPDRARVAAADGVSHPHWGFQADRRDASTMNRIAPAT